MNILNIEHISKTFGDKTIFDDVSLGVHQGDKIGVLGVNGTGKSTLLKIIAGQETADEGEVIFGRGIRTAFLPQNPEFPDGAKVLSYVTEGKHDPDGNERFLQNLESVISMNLWIICPAGRRKEPRWPGPLWTRRMY